MNLMNREPSNPAGPAGESAADRRDRRRVKVTQTIRVRFARDGWVGFDEVTATINVSRHGLYFVTDLDKYTKGLQVLVTYPFSEMPGAMNEEHPGEVVRIDRLPHGRLGIALNMKPAGKR